MLKQLLLLLVVVAINSSCNENPPQRASLKGRQPIIAEKPFPKDKEVPIDIPPAPAPYTGPKKYCFEMEQGTDAKNITRMHFILEDNDSIHGRLDHTFSNRPAILGTIEGIKEGEIIELNYAYIDSGMHKREELVLKLNNENLFKKNGPMVLDERGIWVLENYRLSKFELFLEQRDCQ